MEQSGDPLDDSVAAAVRGDRPALARVIETVRPVVVRYCRARIGPADRVFVSADDVAQEVCLAVITALPPYRDQGRPFLAFVYGIAAHKVTDAYRGMSRSRTEPRAEVPDAPSTEDGPEQRALDSDAGSRMAGLLDTLPDRQREILVLRLIVGLSAVETAQAVGGSAGSVRVAQHRALSKLRTAVAGVAGSQR